MKKAIIAMLAVVAFASVASAELAGSDSNIGCGWGTAAFSGKTNKKLFAIFGATTNGMFTQTFGISSETAGCNVKGGWVRNDKKQAAYAEVNLQKISTEMAQGGGEYLNAFATLMGAKDDATRKEFVAFTQKNYDNIFPKPNTDSATMLKNLRAALRTNPKLATL